MGPPLGGWFYQAFGYEVPFLILGCLLMLMVPFNIYVLPSIGSIWGLSACQFIHTEWKVILWRSLRPLFLCFNLCRGNFFKGLLPPSSRQTKSCPHLLCYLHSQCRTGLLGCHIVTVCYWYGKYNIVDSKHYSLREQICAHPSVCLIFFFFYPSVSV